jgi:hypothetical protein
VLNLTLTALRLVLPCDALQVESMNSVMDDSRLLTLPSNERIRLLPHMKMIFEIRDLKYATPVSGWSWCPAAPGSQLMPMGA